MSNSLFDLIETDKVFFLKSLICLILIGLNILLFKSKIFINSKFGFNSWFSFSFLIFRIIPFVFIYIVLGEEARSDVSMFYDSAKSALQLKFVYRDFESPYAPLFAYITAFPLIFWDSAKAIILEIIIIEAIIVYFTPKVFSIQNPSFLTILYFISPAPFVLIVLGGQEDLWMWGIILLALLIYQKNKNIVLFGVIFGLGLLCTKAILILYLPAIFFYIKKPFHFLLGLLIVGIPSIGFMYYHSELLFLTPIQQANEPRTPNIWSILHPITNGLIPIGPKVLNWIGLATIQFLGIFIAFKNKKSIELKNFMVLVFLAISVWLMVIQQSSLANYTLVFLLPLIFYFDLEKNKNLLIIYLILNVAVVLQPPIWWGLGMPIFSNISDLLIPIHTLEYIFELIIVSSLMFFLFKINKRASSK